MTNNTTNIIGASFEAIATHRIQILETMMTAVINAEQAVMVPVLRALFIIYVGRQFLLMMTGDMVIKTFFTSILRTGVIILLVAHSGEFVSRIEVPVFNDIPRAISSTVLGAVGVDANNTQSVARQFDRTSAAADAVSSLIAANSTNWSVAGLTNSISADIGNGSLQVILACICGIWLCGQTLLAIIMCFGIFILLAELFERTRGWMDQYLGKIFGMLAFGLGTSILLAIEMTELFQQLKSVHDQFPGNTVQAVHLLAHVCADAVLDLLAMVALPVACGFGSGVAASLALPSALLAGRTIAFGTAAAKMAATAGRGSRRTQNNINR